MSSKMQQQQQIDWRRNKVLELSGQGYNQSDIAGILKVDKSIVSRDIKFLRESSKTYPTDTARRIPALFNRNESGVEVKLADC